ncbi:SERHL2 isoform 4 [Pongo abelii]|uniref:SERHL2 isoform 4 n=2 Tax=Pongo abelii TaxID=9601 RepID=A0A2J8TWH1_PONAB|nr:SERHL2 isoform 4 [Pongo abelii]
MAENAAPGLISELKLAVPWGHIAAKAWGSLQGPPVLCLHGWLDNANSFDRLIPLLPPDFYYVAMDFGGHGLSSHYSPGVPYNLQTFVSEIRRVVAALKWNRFSILGHSFGGVVGATFSCTFPEMVDKLTLLDTLLFPLESNEMENLLTYKRRAIEHMLQIEASQEPSHVFSLKQLLQSQRTALTTSAGSCVRIPSGSCRPTSYSSSESGPIPFSHPQGDMGARSLREGALA